MLDGKERSLFVHATACLLDHLVDEAKDNEPDTDYAWPTGVALFDRMEPQARIVLLSNVLQALTDPAIPTPTLSAINEAAVHAVCRFIRGDIEMEIDCERDCQGKASELDGSAFLLGYDPLYWRKVVLAAYLEGQGLAGAGGVADDKILSPACADMEEWDLQLECLAD
jgi:hypothetical protein